MSLMNEEAQKLSMIDYVTTIVNDTIKRMPNCYQMGEVKLFIFTTEPTKLILKYSKICHRTAIGFGHM